MTANVESRRKRGRETERLAALHAANSLPDTTRVDLIASSTAGADIRISLEHGTSAAVEVKGRRGLSLCADLKQAERNAKPDEIPALVVRLDGSGPSDVHNWPCIVRYRVFLSLLERLDSQTSSTTSTEHHDVEREPGPVEAGVLDSLANATHLGPEESGAIANALSLAAAIDNADKQGGGHLGTRAGAGHKLSQCLKSLGLTADSADGRRTSDDIDDPIERIRAMRIERLTGTPN